MINIDWVIVRETKPTQALEFEFADTELRRQIPASARWLVGAEEAQLQTDTSLDPGAIVLVLAHTGITLESRCLDRLYLALQQGFESVAACDSRAPNPMLGGGYATLRGMERFVDDYPMHVLALVNPDASPGALVCLTTVGALRSGARKSVVSGRVSGAFVHDVSNYFGSDRSEVLGLIPATANRFLDIGGGEGNFLRLIKSARGGETHLVEMDIGAATSAKDCGNADHVWNGDFLEYQSSLKFDCISFLDMLEHVANPEQCLAHARTLLSVDGVVLASIPNVGHWSVIADLIEGRWDYVPSGIHCVTHLRFFTQRTIEDLFDRAGFQIQKIERVVVPGPSVLLDRWQSSYGLQPNGASLDTYAFLVVGHPKIQV